MSGSRIGRKQSDPSASAHLIFLRLQWYGQVDFIIPYNLKLFQLFPDKDVPDLPGFAQLKAY